ncbi:MAG: beta-N-acetylhexosaminidase [Zetaproteobacteria bacterium]|nr:beta-N-acetylhexosaminidase [Zetaproteobacteria bacterium]
MNQQDWVVGLRGKMLTEGERKWLSAYPPRGIILFARNIESPEQLKQLIAEAKALAGEALWVAIDEEGGRVHRISWPPFCQRPHAAVYGELFLSGDEAQAKSLVFDDAYRVGLALAALGFTHDCAPVLDIFHPMGNQIIGQRAYAGDVRTVAELACAYMDGLALAGIVAIGKHFPGHGRADADSHLALPHVDADAKVVLAEAQTFVRVMNHGLMHVMSAHVIYDALDPQLATFSSYWLQTVLRQQFGYQGEIWSDDLCMKGAGNDIFDAVAKAVRAGCTVPLICEPASVGLLYDRILGRE